MNFFKKLRFWKKRRNNAITSRDIAARTDNVTLDTGTQVSSIELILRCDAGTQVDSILTREASTQTSHRNKKPKNRTHGGAADKEQEELKRKIATLENILEENDLQIRKQNERIKEMKEQHRSEIQYIRRKEEIEKRSLLQKIRRMRDEIISLEKRRSPKRKRAEPSAEQGSLGPGWNHVVSGGRVVKAATPNSAPKVAVGPKQAPVTENQRSDHTGRREAGESSNCQQLAKQRHCPNLPTRLQGNLPPRQQNRNLPPRLQNRNS
jgi:hypothetical protein